MENEHLAFKSFSSESMAHNVGVVRGLIQKIRQKEGLENADSSEMALHRIIHDMDMLVEITGGLKASYEKVKEQLEQVAATALSLQKQKDAIQEAYEKMIAERNTRIKELEEKLGEGKEPRNIEETHG